ncbi:MAG: ABC transporter ATP-binding protein [Aristaeellaceae bacterium]
MKRSTPDIRACTRQFYRGNRLSLALALCGSVLMTLATLLLSWLLQQILDLMGAPGTGLTLRDLTLITLMLVGLVSAVFFISYHSRPRFVTRGISQYKEYVFQELTKKSIAAFSGENSSTYISALTNDIQVIEQGYLLNTFTLFDSLLTFCGAVALMLWYSPLLTLLALGLSLLPLAASLLTGNRIAQSEKAVSRLNEAYTSTLKDCLGGFSVIKSFQAEAQMLRLFRENLQKVGTAQCGRQKIKILVQAFASIAGIIAQLGIFLFGAYLALSGDDVTAGTTLIFVQLMNYVLSPIQTLPTCIAERKAARALVEKVAGLLNANVRESSGTECRELEHGIEIRDLRFGYEPGKQVLRGISCSFELGRKYAIVGASGSGKSTLLNLLMASHQAYEGTIRFDGTELRQLSTRSLYERVSVVQQHVFIFNASIRDNITMFADFPREEVDRAIELSGLSGLIAARGEEYLCGENGSGLSGGEKQRISIARCLLRKSQVLLMDEATAALDAQTSFRISSAILDMNALTRIVVTHTLDEGLLKRYDQILTLRNGRIAESGTFDELMAQKGYFYSLYTVSQ